LTDFRYQQHAEADAGTWYDIVLYPRSLVELLAKLLPKLGLSRLAFESHAMMHATATRLHTALQPLGVETVGLTGLVEGLRRCKSEAEIELIRRAVRLNEKVFGECFKALQPGMTETEAAQHIEATMRRLGAEGPAFATIVAAGPNGALPHGVPTERTIRQGEPVVIDMGLRLAGYCSDMTRTVVLGSPDQLTVKRIRLVRQAQKAAIALIRAGAIAREVDGAARRVIAAADLGDRFGHGLGHGVGLAVHEAPALNRRNRGQLKSGMVVTVEPGVYLPEWGGIRLENMVVVRPDGCEVLNSDTTFLDM
jgi:Xaa-Pro aminopeptidase